MILWPALHLSLVVSAQRYEGKKASLRRSVKGGFNAVQVDFQGGEIVVIAVADM